MTTQAQSFIRCIGLIVKNTNSEAAKLAREIAVWLESRHIASWLACHSQDTAEVTRAREADLVLVLGGDGSFISVSRALLGTQRPVGGINFGRVGFLTELSRANWQQGLENILANGLQVEQRLSLHYELVRDEAIVAQGAAINDVVLTRGKLARLVPFSLHVNGKPFVFLRADGLIVSTPTGSTGYTRSAGGPVLLPTINSYVVSAICPFLCTFPPTVFEAETLLSITVKPATLELFLTVDGQELFEMFPGDILRVWGKPRHFHLASFGMKSYLERLTSTGLVQGALSRPDPLFEMNRKRGL